MNTLTHQVYALRGICVEMIAGLSYFPHLKSQTHFKSNFMCVTQNHTLQFVLLDFNKLYRCDDFCLKTLELGEEKNLKS